MHLAKSVTSGIELILKVSLQLIFLNKYAKHTIKSSTFAHTGLIKELSIIFAQVLTKTQDRNFLAVIEPGQTIRGYFERK